MGLASFIKDNWENVVKGIGGKRDANIYNQFGNFTVLDDTTLASMYAGDGWQKKVASIPAGSMVREWIAIADDADSKIKEMLEDLDAQNVFKEAIVWQRVFRGGLIWMISNKSATSVYKQGEKIDIQKLMAFSASEVRINEMYTADSTAVPGSAVMRVTRDPLKIGTVKSFKIVKNHRRDADIIVDASQCLIFKGDPIPSVPSAAFNTLFHTADVDVLEYEYWGMGALQSIFPQMSKYGIFESAMGKISTELVVAIYKMAGLREILQADGGDELIKKRVDTIDMTKSVINAVFMDAEGGEEFSRNSINLSGVPDLWDRFMMTVSGVTNIPASKLFGRQASGLNNKGEQDERNYNDYIVEEQGKDMKRNLIILLWYLTGKKVAFTFNSPWAPSQAEMIDMRHKQAEMDKVYLEAGALMAEEVRVSRFEKTYSFETQLMDIELPDEQNGDNDLPEGNED
jgi:phage-related protein (TIGR01555 family)